MSAPVCMWSGPRNLSTAMMRSFGSRKDCEVWDEPFFASFLEASGKAHPGRQETLERHETNPEKVAELCLAHKKKPYYFQKHMAHHMLPGFPRAWMAGVRHFFLLREPERVISSYAKGRADFTVEDLGFEAQKKLYIEIAKLTGKSPSIIDSVDILRNPKVALQRLCKAIDIPFDPAMLSWEPGPRPEDGAWAPYWYASVEKSTGFADPTTEKPKVPQQYADMLEACRADFDVLFEKRIRV